MNQQDLLERFLFIYTRKTAPDGRPLYAYKCRDKDYNGIEMVVRKLLEEAVKGNTPLLFSPFFCLYAAESWRRKHTGGPWKWETVFADICHFVPDHPYIAKWVRKGLAYWRRPLLKSDIGHNQYLVTIACEGGLPLLLLQNENASLYRYFKNLLKSYHQERQSPFCNPVAIARRLSGYLPPRLQQEIVFNLGGDLVQKIVELQEKIPNALDPIQALDVEYPNWRDTLPLPLEEETVELLLKNLVHELQEIIITERQRVRWRRRLIWINGQATIEQQLELPTSFKGASLKRWSNRSELPERMRLMIQSAKGIEPVALITRMRGDGDDAVYRCEMQRRGGLRMIGEHALRPIQLLLVDGSSETIVPTQGGNDWGPLPWIFCERHGQLEYLGEGSVRSKDETAHVLFPSNGQVTSENGSATYEGDVTEIQRQLWQITGTVSWEHEDLGMCRIRCADPDAQDINFMLDGRNLHGTAEQSPPYLGIPTLVSFNQNDVCRTVEDATATWRPYATGEKAWREELHQCFGEVWLRWANSNGEQLMCRRTRIVPYDASIEIAQVGTGDKPGKIRLKRFSGAAVAVGEVAECKINQQSDLGVIEIDCIAETGLPLTQFQTKLYWPDGRHMDMQLPFPREGAAFIHGDEALPPGDRVPVAKLAAIQAVAQATSVARKFYLKVKIKSRNSLFGNLRIRNALSDDDSGRSSFQLHRMQERISSIIGLTGELDAIAVLEIVDQTNRSLAHLEAGQFDMDWEADWEKGLLVLPPKYSEHLDTGWEERVSVRMVPLWDPTSESVVLETRENSAEWLVPGNLTSGPWWVLGEDGDWARFRPLLWVVVGEPVATESPLKRAILTDDKEIREVLLPSWVEQIALDPDHTDWPLFFSYLDLVRPYPASALDLFCYFVQSPEAMVLALLKSADDNFNAVWSLTYQLPFSWYLVPVNAWLASANRYFATLRVALSGIDSADDLLWSEFQSFRERVTVRRPFFRQICDWICPVIFPKKTLENSELAIAQQCPDVFFGFIQEQEQKLQGRHGADEIYPEGSKTMAWTEREDYPKQHAYLNLADHLRPVRCAPFVAAHISLGGEPFKEVLLFELKRLRDFDREWFTTVYAFALCLGLSRIPAV